MTTVAFRDGTMAADSLANDDNVGAVKVQKIYRKKIKGKEYIFGIAGYLEAGQMFIEWFSTRDQSLMDRLTKLTEDDSFDVLIWNGKKLMIADQLMRLTEINDEYFAIGSGAPHAITAMDCGRSARQAVQMAMKRDINTGGRVVTMRLSSDKTKLP